MQFTSKSPEISESSHGISLFVPSFPFSVFLRFYSPTNQQTGTTNGCYLEKDCKSRICFCGNNKQKTALRNVICGLEPLKYPYLRAVVREIRKLYRFNVAGLPSYITRRVATK